MSLRESLESDLKEALRAGDRTRLSAIRMCLAAVQSAESAKVQALYDAEIEKGRPAESIELGIDKGRALDDAEVLAVLQKQAKRHRESILEFSRAKRDDLVAKEEAELAVVESYLPRQLSREEVTELARQIIAEVGAQGPREIGKVMPRLMAAARGRADGKLASQVVQELLAGR